MFLEKNSIKKFVFNCVGIVIIVVIIVISMNISTGNGEIDKINPDDIYQADASGTTGMDADITFVDGQPILGGFEDEEPTVDMSNTTDVTTIGTDETATYPPMAETPVSTPMPTYGPVTVSTPMPTYGPVTVSTPMPTYGPVTVSTPTPTYRPVIVSTPTPTYRPVIVSTPTPTRPPVVSTPTPTRTPSPTQKPVTSEYILPYSNSKFYTRAEISGLSASQLRLARNEIYARHGAIFTSPDLDAHFRSCSWYRPTIKVSLIDEDAAFNVYEYTNMEVIRGLE